MTSSTEDRLRDALHACRDQIHASPALWPQIERSFASRPRTGRRRGRWVAVAAGLGAVAAAATAIVAANRPGSGPNTDVATAPPSITQFIDRANQACDDLTSADPYPPIVFNTPTAYADAADRLTAAVRAWVDNVDRQVPPAAQPAIDSLVADAGTIAADAGRMKTFAASGDLNGAAGALRSAEAAITDAGHALVAVGAQRCQHL